MNFFLDVLRIFASNIGSSTILPYYAHFDQCLRTMVGRERKVASELSLCNRRDKRGLLKFMHEDDATALFHRVIQAFTADQPIKRRCDISLVYYQLPGLHSVPTWKVRVLSDVSSRVYMLSTEQSWQECKRELGIEE